MPTWFIFKDAFLTKIKKKSLEKGYNFKMLLSILKDIIQWLDTVTFNQIGIISNIFGDC